MSRDANGTYSLPGGNPVITGTTISSTWANTTLSDVGAALTDSLSRSGLGGMSAALKLFDGVAGTPGLNWSTETNSGLYRAGAGDFRWVISATELIRLTSNKVNFGDATFTPASLTAGNINVVIGGSASPIFYMYEGDAAANEKIWRFQAQNGDFFAQTRTDADGAGAVWMSLVRSGTTITELSLSATTFSLTTTTATTVGAAGGASALPATPVGYLSVTVNGTARKIPYYTT